MTNYIPKQEQLTGANLSGSDGAAGRTYTLANDNAVLAQMRPIIAQAILQPITDFTLDTSTNIITFVNAVWNDQDITIDYFITEDNNLSGGSYTNTKDIAWYGGLGLEKTNVNLGTGDGSTASYNFTHGNVIDNSYSVYYGASGSNSLSNLAENTDYTINLDGGGILLTASGIAKVNGNVIYAKYTYSPKHTNSLLSSYLLPATAEAEALTGNYWGSVKSTTEYFDGSEYGPSDGYPRTDRPHGNDRVDYDYPEIFLLNQSVQSVTPVQFLSFSGTPTTTIDSDNIQYDEDGRVMLNASIPLGKKNILITYTHGYDDVPPMIQELTGLIGAWMALVNISGGSYKDISSYTIGRKTFTIGQIYVNVESSIRKFKERIDWILDNSAKGYWCE